MKLIKNRPFTAKVVALYPDVEGGVEQSFTAHFITLPINDLKQFQLNTVEEQDAFLDRVFVGWSGLTDDRDGVEVTLEVNATNRALLLNDLFLRRAVLDAYNMALMGVRRGN